jgi:hypothetical protein
LRKRFETSIARQKLVREFPDYNPKTGELRWKRERENGFHPIGLQDLE